MARFELKMPKLGESVQEAIITKWMVGVGDTVEEDDNLLEIATDKVDSEIPSPVDGKIVEILFPVNSLVPVGEVIAIIQTGADSELPVAAPTTTGKSETPAKESKPIVLETNIGDINKNTTAQTTKGVATTSTPAPLAEKPLVSASVSAGDEIVEMDRMRKLIAQYMVNSKRVSPHVTTMVEVDVTPIVLWR